MSLLSDRLPSVSLFDSTLEELSDVQLLALVLGPGKSEEWAVDKARRFLDRLGTIERLKSLSYYELRTYGLEHDQVLALLAAQALFRRIGQQKLQPGEPLRSSQQIYRHFQPLLAHLRQECFWCCLLDGRNRMQRLVRISQGTLTSSVAHPREVFRPAVCAAAAAVLFVHNHPSGDPQPSHEDIRITHRLVKTGGILGIRVLDHVIVAEDCYYSFSDQGML